MANFEIFEKQDFPILNKSFSAILEVEASRLTNQQFIPIQASGLTMFLQDSLIENS
jgi:hypothetical protein